MGMTWKERLEKVVLPALVDGVYIYCAFGELTPGPGVNEGDRTPEAVQAAEAKPKGLPEWQVYLGAKPTQPALRFIQFTHKPRNPAGSAVQVYPRGAADKNLGVPLTLPLGEGLDTPDYELRLARDLQAQVMYKPVRVIALGRSRFYHTRSNIPFCEPVIMEIYSEAGELLWTNPYIGMSLEEAVAMVKRADIFRTPAPVAAPAAAPAAPVVPFSQPGQGPVEPTAQVVVDKRQKVEGDIRNLYSNGVPEEEIKAHLTRIHGFDPKVSNRLYEDFKKRNEPSEEVKSLVRQYAVQFEGLYEGDELYEVIAETSEVRLDMVRRVLQTPTLPQRPAPAAPVIPLVPTSAPSPAPEAPTASAPAPAPAAPAFNAPGSQTEVLARVLGVGEDKGPLSVQVGGVVRDRAELPAVLPPPLPPAPKPRPEAKPRTPRVPKNTAPVLPGSDEDRVRQLLYQIHNHTEELQRKVIGHLTANPKAQASELREVLGLDSGSTGPMKQVSDHFRRTILDPLERNGNIVCEGTGRVAAYKLVRQS